MAESTGIDVTMETGIVEHFNGDEGAPRSQKMKKTVDVADDGVITATLMFRNGAVRTVSLPTDLLAKCAAHGLSQKLSDDIAGLSDIDDCVISIEQLIGRIEKSEWTATRAKGAGKGASMLVTALMEVTGKDMETVKAFLAEKSDDDKRALRASERVRPVFARLQAEKAAKKAGKDGVDAEALLGELG